MAFITAVETENNNENTLYIYILNFQKVNKILLMSNQHWQKKMSVLSPNLEAERYLTVLENRSLL